MTAEIRHPKKVMTDNGLPRKHDWQHVTWASGRHKGKRTKSRQCVACELWETRTSTDGECPGKRFAEMTHEERVRWWSL